MALLDIIFENTSMIYLFCIVTIAQILQNKMNSPYEGENSNKQNRNIYKVKYWILIIHLIAFIIIGFLIFYINSLSHIFKILVILFFITIIISCFILIIKNVKNVSKSEFGNFEIDLFLNFAYFVVIVFYSDIKKNLQDTLIIIENNHMVLFECITLTLLILKVFFIVFLGLYGMLIIIKNIGIIFSKIKNKIKYKSRLLKSIYNYLIIDDLYFYDFVLLNRYKNIKVLLPLLFIIDLIVLMVCDMLMLFIFFIKYPILALIILIKNLHNYLCAIKNLSIASFAFKWFRIIIIFSITFTYIIIKVLKINISSSIMDIFEFISTVILIPLILDQLLKFKEKTKN